MWAILSCILIRQRPFINRVIKSQDNTIEFENEFVMSVIDKNLLPSKVIRHAVYPGGKSR